jgi:hypothetical protein
MTKTVSRKVKSRWIRGAARYDAKQAAEISKKYHEHGGWKNGAKVRRK